MSRHVSLQHPGLFFGRLVNTVHLLLLAALSGCSFTPAIVDERGKPVEGSVASAEEVSLNGTPHFMLLRGASAELPVLLVVHGGLGTPYSPLGHTFQREWERHFIVVHVDQRGSGKLYDKSPPERVTAEQLLDDTRAAAAYLNERFGRKVYVMGHSWGSYLALRTVAAHPELFMAYVGVGQTVGLLKDDVASHAWAVEQANARGDAEGQAALESIGAPPYADVHHAYEVKYGLVEKYGGMMNVPGGLEGFMPKALMNSCEYSFGDAMRYLDGMKHYEKHLLGNAGESMWQLSVEDITRLEVPAFFIQGENDHATPTALAFEYAGKLSAPHKELITVKDASHFPFIEQPAEFTRLLVEHVLGPR